MVALLGGEEGLESASERGGGCGERGERMGERGELDTASCPKS